MENVRTPPTKILNLLTLAIIVVFLISNFDPSTNRTTTKVNGFFSHNHNPPIVVHCTDVSRCLHFHSSKDIFEEISPSVVHVDVVVFDSNKTTTASTVTSSFGEQRRKRRKGVLFRRHRSGSGIVWDTNGIIVTSYRIVQSSPRANVTITIPLQLHDGQTTTTTMAVRDKIRSLLLRGSRRRRTLSSTTVTYEAIVLGTDPQRDVAVLQLLNVTSSLFHPPSSINVGGHMTTTATQRYPTGEPAYAIAHVSDDAKRKTTDDRSYLFTAGVIIGYHKIVEDGVSQSIIETRVAIDKRYGGGPLLDGYGHVIGMITGMANEDVIKMMDGEEETIDVVGGDCSGICGWSIPLDDLRSAVVTIQKIMMVTTTTTTPTTSPNLQTLLPSSSSKAVLGIVTLKSHKSQQYGIKKGVLVVKVPHYSPAYAAGLEGTVFNYVGGIWTKGDVIVGVGEDDVIEDDFDLVVALSRYKPGDKVTLVVERGGKEAVGGSGGTVLMKIKTTLIEMEEKNEHGDVYLDGNV